MAARKTAEKKTPARGRAPAKRQEAPPPAAYDYGGYAGAGYEGSTQDDYAIARLLVLQAISPQINEVPGAKAGDFINSVTNETYDGRDGLPLVCFATEHNVVEWVPRTEGGGFAGVHEMGSKVVKAAMAKYPLGGWKAENGNDLVETYTMYSILDLPDGPEMMTIPFSSTKIGAYKGCRTLLRKIIITGPDGRKIKPPLFAHRVRLTTFFDSNKKGEFWNVNLMLDGETAAECRLAPDSDLFQTATEGYEAWKDSGLAVNYEEATASGAEVTDDEVPF